MLDMLHDAFKYSVKLSQTSTPQPHLDPSPTEPSPKIVITPVEDQAAFPVEHMIKPDSPGIF